jgi:hypothetical protein
VSNGQEVVTAPRRFDEAARLLAEWLTQGRWAPEVHWPAQEDLSVRGASVILRKPVSPSGIEQHRARYQHGLRSGSRIVLAVVARSFGATFGVVDLREADTPSHGRRATVGFELWDFPLRLMTARYRTGWWRLQDAACHPQMARLLEEYGKL